MSTQFNQALQAIREYAKDQFDLALTKATEKLPEPPPVTAPASEREKAKQKAEEQAKARGQLASSFAQIGDADKQELEAKGYVDVVDLMHTTATTAASVCLKIGVLVGTEPSATVTQAMLDNRITALSGVLTALAKLSPAPLWNEPPPAAAGDTSA